MLENKSGRWSKFKDYFGNSIWQRRILNPDPYTLLNTIEKMAQKRAYVGAVILAVNGSGFFGSYEAHSGDAPRAGQRRQAAKPKGLKLGADANDFAAAKRTSGIQEADAKPIAARAASGEITWEEAITLLPN